MDDIPEPIREAIEYLRPAPNRDGDRHFTLHTGMIRCALSSILMYAADREAEISRLRQERDEAQAEAGRLLKRWTLAREENERHRQNWAALGDLGKRMVEARRRWEEAERNRPQELIGAAEPLPTIEDVHGILRDPAQAGR